jgi:hypothetical protein
MQLLRDLLEPKLAALGIKNIQYSDKFLEQLTETVFSHKQGARSLAMLIDGPINNLLTKAVLSLNDLTLVKESNFKVSFLDSYGGRHTYEGMQPDSRQVEVRVEVNHPKREQQLLVEDVSDYIAKRQLRTVEDLQRTAYHEAGHVVGNIPELTGRKSKAVTIQGAEGFYGYARSSTDSSGRSPGRQEVLANIAMMLGGAIAEELMGYKMTAGWQSDVEKASSIALEAVTRWRLVDEPLSLPVTDKGQVDVNDRHVRFEVEKMLGEARDMAIKRLKEQWLAVHLLQEKLMEEYMINEDGIESILEYARSEDYLNYLRTEGKEKPRYVVDVPTKDRKSNVLGFDCGTTFEK